MASNAKKDSNLIDLINKTYHYHKRVLFEAENGIKNYDYLRVRASRIVVSHIDNVVNDLTGRIKLIIESEVVGNMKGTKWYIEFFSMPSYYRARKIAYKMFIENIEK